MPSNRPDGLCRKALTLLLIPAVLALAAELTLQPVEQGAVVRSTVDPVLAITAEAGGATLGLLAVGLAGLVCFALLAHVLGLLAFLPAVAVAGLLGPMVVGLGVSMAGKAVDDRRAYWPAAAGAYAGVAISASWLALSAPTSSSTLPLQLAPVLTGAGAVVGYRLGRPIAAAESGVLNRLELPRATLTVERMSDGRTNYAVRASLVLVRL